MNNEGLVYIGKIVALEPIPNADFIVSATVICGKGGKWKGIVRKSEFWEGAECLVFLPDSLLNEVDHVHLRFMKNSNWRVKMKRLKGTPSEVLITQHFPETITLPIGTDVTSIVKVTKYHKPIPPNLAGKAKGLFPGFIPKTDEPNYQNQEGQEGIEKLIDHAYYITEKCDGSSTTAYKYKGEFGVCSRNWELLPDENNGYWKVAYKYKLHENLPENYALQWETCGPGIQSNPMGLDEIDGFAFSVYNILEKRYLTMFEFRMFCLVLDFPTVKMLEGGNHFSKENIETLGEGTYSNGKQREGVVVRSQENLLGHKPVSFKVINLNYEK